MSGDARRRAAPAADPAQRFRLPPPPRIAAGTPDHLRLAITLTCRRPELRPLCAGVLFAVDAALEAPFRAATGQRIDLHPVSLADRRAAAVILRQALEQALWQRLGGTGHDHARSVAARYRQGLPASERGAGYDTLPDATPLPELAAPSEHLLTLGGGSRLQLDPDSALNAYGCAARPQPEALAFASSTASTISAPAYAEVEALRQSLLRAGVAGRLPGALADLTHTLKTELLGTLGIAERAAEVVLLPSGTDGEYAALQIARRRRSEPLVNLVIAPDETGSGVLEAAAGRHFGTVTARGARRTKGEPLPGLAVENISVEVVQIRAPDGTPRPLGEIDAEVGALAGRAIARGARCLVHLLDASKTGLAAPSRGALEALCALHGERLAVVVDACQMRQDADRLRADLARGWMVLLTGSKFAMGPAFSGALLLPRRIADDLAGREPLPAGFGAYFGRAEWPDRWRSLTAALPETANLGLLLRWRAALWEMQALRAVPAALRLRIIRALGAAIEETLQGATALEPLVGGGDGTPTIFPFGLRHAGEALSFEATRRVWRWLREDLSARLPASASPGERRLAAFACQVGQPVRIGAGAALRLCIGAHAISRVAFDPALGGSLEQRLARQVGRARSVLDKAALIVRHLDRLS